MKSEQRPTANDQLLTMRIFLIGFMGCGKTHWGEQLSHKLQMPFFDLDSVIEEQEGKSISEIFAERGEEHFRLLEKDALYKLRLAS